MFDAPLRRLSAPPLERAGVRLHEIGVRADWLTAAGWVLGAGACAAAAVAAWPFALVLWLANRLVDGLDGSVARAAGPTPAGGFLDIVADFSVYAGFVVGVAIAEPPARLACVVLLATYYVSGTAFLALSSLLERSRATTVDGDGRSLLFVGGLAEGSETIAAYILFCLLPGHAAAIAWVFAGAVAMTALQRTWQGWRRLRAVTPEAGSPSPDAATTESTQFARSTTRRRGRPIELPAQPAARRAATSTRRAGTPGR